MAIAIKEHIAALREEVERQYSERLAAIAALEASLLGTPNGEVGSEVETLTEPAVEVAASVTPMFDNIIKVRRALSKTEFRTIRELSRSSGLDQFAVRNSLKSKTLSRAIEKKKEDGGPFTFRLKAVTTNSSQKSSGHGETPTMADAIRRVLSSEPKGLLSSEIADRAVPIAKPKGKDPRAPVFSRLNRMRERGHLLYDESTKIYKLAKSK